MTDVEQFARDLGMDPRELLRDLGERELQMLAGMYARFETASTMKPQEFLPLKVGKREIGEVGASIPEDLFFHLHNRGESYGLQQMLEQRDLRELNAEFPVTRVETVSGKAQVGYRRSEMGDGRKRGGVRFDSTVKTNFAR